MASEEYKCPICFYGHMEDPPENYNICPQCGTEFGISDEYATHEELRGAWIADERKVFMPEHIKQVRAGGAA